MLYMVRPGIGERIAQFVENGGTFVAAYWSGIADEYDLCFLGGFPGPLWRTLGIWVEEIDALPNQHAVHLGMATGNALGLTGSFTALELYESIHLEGAEALAHYRDGMFKGSPALTVH